MNELIHVLNFEGQIIDFISQSDSTIIRAEHNRDINERTETFDFTILSKRTEHLQKRNRIIIEDSNKQYREFIIEHISQDIDGYTEIETTASYFEDLANAKPYGPSTLSKMTTKQALSDVLKDTGLEVSDQTEYGGIRTTSWTSYQKRYEVLLQLCTTYNMMPDFYIELGNNTVEGRYVVLRKRNPMFNGKEITYGKDLIGLKRTVDFTDVKTALLCVGPEKDDGSRIELVVKDDEAQEKFGLPGRYSWAIYEPESDDQNMTEARLRTLGITELNKRKSELISYEVTSTDISTLYKHEVTHLGDMVRIKNRDFTPPLYVEAEVISEQYDMIAEESTYGFGQYKEYRESELRNEFDKKLSDIRQKMHDNISNVNTIIQDTISGELEYYEKKIIKSDTPPKNPVDDMLWLDTSNPDVMVLWRYFNGEWREHSVKDVEKIGGITREKAMFSELSNTFINLSIQHSKLLSDVYEVINSEYFVDTDLKNEVNSKLNDTIGVFNQIKTNLDSMTPETATIGKLIDTQLLFLTYRERMQSLYKAVENAKISIDDRFKLLQSQYTEEKYIEAMSKVAEAIGGTYYEETGQLIADIPNKEMLEEMRISIQNAMTNLTQENANKLQELQNGITQTNQRLTSTNEELSAGIESITQKVEGMHIDNKNLIRNSEKYNDYIILAKVEKAGTYSLGFEPHFTKNIPETFGVFYGKNIDVLLNDKPRITHTFEVSEDRIGKDIRLFFGGTYSKHSDYANNGYVENIKLEYNSFATEWTPAPEDIQEKIEKAQQEATDAAKAYADAQDNLKAIETKAYADGIVDAEEQRAIDDAQAKLTQAKTYAEQKATEAKNAAITDTTNQLKPIKTTVETQSADISVLKDGIKLKADKTEVNKIYTDYLTPLQTQVNQQKASLDVLPSQIAAKVSQAQYTADMNNVVGRLNTADTERTQLSNQIKDRVTLNEYQATKDKIDNLKVGGKNLVLNSYGKYTNHTSYGKYYDLSEDWIIGETYTVTLKGQPNTNHYFSAYIDDGYSNLCTLKYDETTGLWKGTGIAGTSTRNKPKLLGVYDMPKDGNYNATIEWIKVEKGTISTDYEKAPEDTDKRLTTMETSIEQNGQQINLKASRDELNNSKKTLSRVIADLTVNTTDGLTLSYDENGIITSHVVGPNGVKIKGDKVDIKANSNFSVLVDDVNSKVDKKSIVSSINATPERIDINTQNVGIFGGSGQSYIKIKNDEIESSGRYTRTWFDKTTTNNVRFRVRNGYSYMENIDEDKRLYFTDKGISTFISGYSDENPNYESHGSGVIEFFSHQYDPDIRGLTLFSNRGTIALQTRARDIILDSDRDIRLNTNRGSVFLEMNNTNRPGDNTFNFYIKNNDSASDTDGVFRFGSKRLNYSCGLRFEKTTEGKPMIYVTNGNGDKYTGSIDVVDIHVRGDIRAPQDFSLRTIDGTGYRALTASTYASYNSVAFRSHSGKNVYFGVGLNELRITDNNGYQENDTRYKPVLASDFVKASREEFKEDIKLWDYDALNVIVKELQLYSYKYKNDKRGLIQHGPVIGDQYETPTEFIFGDGINTNEMLSFALRAIQQLNDKIKILEGITNE